MYSGVSDVAVKHNDIEYRISDIGYRISDSGLKTKKKKDGPGPVMVSDTLCPAVRIIGT